MPMRPNRAAPLVVLSLIALATTPAFAAPCRDAHGKFTKCAGKAAVPKAPCKDAKGRFIKCK